MMAAAAVVVLIAFGIAHAEGGFAFCVKPGMLVNAAQVGYKSDNLFAGVGCEFVTVGLSSKYSETDSTYEPPTSTTQPVSTTFPCSCPSLR